MSARSCAWDSTGRHTCLRPAGASGYCRWHAVSHRLDLLWRVGPPEGFASVFVATAVFVLAGKFVLHGIRHVLMLGSGERDNILATDPFYAAMLLGLATFFMAKALLICRRSDTLVRRRRLIPLAAGALPIGGVAVLMLPWAKTGTHVELAGWMMLALAFLLAMVLLEWRAVPAAGVLAAGGLALVLGGGLIPPLLEIVHALTGRGEYLPAVDAALRPALVRREIILSVTMAAAAADGLWALCVTGRPLTPVGWLKHLGELSKQSPLRLIAWPYAMLIVLYGQGMVVRYCAWAVAHGFVLDAIPYYDLLYMVIAIGLHYAFARGAGAARAC